MRNRILIGMLLLAIGAECHAARTTLYCGHDANQSVVLEENDKGEISRGKVQGPYPYLKKWNIEFDLKARKAWVDGENAEIIHSTKDTIFIRADDRKVYQGFESVLFVVSMRMKRVLGMVGGTDNDTSISAIIVEPYCAFPTTVKK